MNKSANLLEIELAHGPASPRLTAVVYLLAAAVAASLIQSSWLLAMGLGACLLGWRGLIAYRAQRKWIILDRQGSWYIRTDEKTISFIPGPETRLMGDYVCIVPADHSLLGLRRWFVPRRSTSQADYSQLKRALRSTVQAHGREQAGV